MNSKLSAQYNIIAIVRKQFFNSYSEGREDDFVTRRHS